MKPARLLSVALLLTAFPLAAGAQEAAAPQKLLYFSCTEGFRHSAAWYAKPIVTELGEQSGAFRVICSEDPRVIDPVFLADTACVVFGNVTGSVLNEAQKAALLEYVRGGGGFVGIHAATDAHYDWPEYRDLIGGWFDGHPWTEQVTVRIEVPEHPACRPVPSPWVINDEIYQHRDWSRDDVCVLMSLDPNGTDFAKDGIKRADLDFGICWCKQFGQGRSIYTALGHREEVWDDPVYQAHLLNCILWAMGDLEGTCEPHPKAE